MRSAEGLILEILALLEDERNARGNAIGAWNHDELAARLVEACLHEYADGKTATMIEGDETIKFVDGSPVPADYLEKVTGVVNVAIDDDPGEFGEIAATANAIGMKVLVADKAPEETPETEHNDTLSTFEHLFGRGKNR